jgi:CheY-like chemotaxis protein
VQVERVINNQEVVAKPYGAQLARVPGLAGLTVLANGTIALLINPLNLILSQDSESSQLALRESPPTPPTQPAPLLPVLARPLMPMVAAPNPVAPVLPLAPLARLAPVAPIAPIAPIASAVVEAPAPVLPVLPVVPVPLIAPVLPETATMPAVVSLKTVSAEPSVPVERTIAAPVMTSPVVESEPAPSAKVEAAAAPQPQPQPQTATVTPIRGRVAVESRVPVVLVVDDSLTVRKITTRLLEREGYKALTAKDGLDALQILADVNPDVILLDIEMPRMDGFEFTRTIKADGRQSHIPIIMITSRTAEKHRNHAIELGVNEYVGKPYQDEHLMALVVKYAGKPS